VSRILIVEDEDRIAAFLEKGLRAHGFATTVAPDGERALRALRPGGYDLVVLDLGLPDMDGLEVLRRLRALDHKLPVIVLTARDGPSDTVSGLESGADDYVSKPFSFEEFLARVRARLRGQNAPATTVLEAGGVTLDLRTRRARVEDREIDLSAREFALAEVFFRHPGQVLSREQLLNQVWGYDYDPGSNIVEVYVGYLRRKVDVPYGRRAIQTVRGVGYRLAPDGG
jgi:DNA-binding response OmpR family regulator